jgi:hypothetical protein
VSYAAAASETLRTAAMAQYEPLKRAVAETAKAVTRLREQTDIVLMMGAADDLSLAAEALATTAKAFHEAADAALVAAMESSGCTGFATQFRTTSLREGTPSVDIIDSAAIPAAFMVERPPIPDKRAIAKALRANGAVNWARLTTGKPGLTRRSNAT